MSLHVDDLINSGTPEFLTWFLRKIKEHFTVGHEDKNDLTFTGRRVRWVFDAQGNKKYISIDQKLCVSELEEIVILKHLKDADACDKALHTSYRSLLGSINWLQSRTQFQVCYQFSRLASASAAPTVGHCKELNKLCRHIRSEEVELRVWPVKGTPRILGIPDGWCLRVGSQFYKCSLPPERQGLRFSYSTSHRGSREPIFGTGSRMRALSRNPDTIKEAADRRKARQKANKARGSTAPQAAPTDPSSPHGEASSGAASSGSRRSPEPRATLQVDMEKVAKEASPPRAKRPPRAKATAKENTDSIQTLSLNSQHMVPLLVAQMKFHFVLRPTILVVLIQYVITKRVCSLNRTSTPEMAKLVTGTGMMMSR